jgi:DNA ligase D-like protein (predicted ligase)
MHAALVAQLPSGSGWAYEVKYDGYRALAVRTGKDARLLSRRGNDLRIRFPSVVAALGTLPVGTMLDGEVVALDETGRMSFQRLQRFGTTRAPLVYYVFDLLASEGRSLLDVPLRDRRALLEAVLRGARDPIRLSDRFEVSAADFVAAAKQLGVEGVVGKRLDSVYEPGERSGNWVKQRVSAGQELVVGGYLPGGHRFDSLLVDYYDGRRLMFVGKLKNGFVPATREQVAARFKGLETVVCPFVNLPEPKNARQGLAITREVMPLCRWLKPKVVVQVEFVEWTENGHLRHARFIGLRDDKKPREVTREAVSRHDAARSSARRLAAPQRGCVLRRRGRLSPVAPPRGPAPPASHAGSSARTMTASSIE